MGIVVLVLSAVVTPWLAKQKRRLSAATASAGGLPDNFDADFPSLDSKAIAQIRLLWIACGTEGRLIDLNRNLRAWLKSKGITHVDIETNGEHTWMVWRRNLSEFVPLLFR